MRDVRQAIVTGPTGVVGAALATLLLREGFGVVAVCRPGSTRRENLPESDRLTVVECALPDIARLPGVLREQGIAQSDVFFHLGWEATFGADARNDLDAQMRNVEYAIEAVRVAHALGCGVFVGAGSQAEYGRVEGKLTSELPTYPENGYGAAKLAACHMTRLACEACGMRQNWVRILSVYGPYEKPGTVISSTIRTLIEGNVPALTPGEQLWDFLYAEDAARGLLSVAEKGRPGAIYPLGSGVAWPLKRYLEVLRDTIDPKLGLDFGARPYGAKQVMRLQADLTKLTCDTGFVPQVPFEQGIRDTIEWVRATTQREAALAGES